MNKKDKLESQQLGMNRTTAASRLVKDLLYKYITLHGEVCDICNKPMTRKDFSIQHRKPWRHSENAAEMYFDLDNIAFAHLSCNSSIKRDPRKPSACGTISKYTKGCRCPQCKEARRKYSADNYTQEKRHEKYLKYEKSA